MKRIVQADRGPANQFPSSAATVANGLCFVSGLFGTGPDGRPLGDAAAQLAAAVHTLDGILAAAGAGRGDVLRTTLLLRSLDDFPAVNDAYRALFPVDPPARVVVQAAALLFDAAVEIDAIAALPTPDSAP